MEIHPHNNIGYEVQLSSNRKLVYITGEPGKSARKESWIKAETSTKWEDIRSGGEPEMM
jgi:hypothetical protein